MLHPAETVYPVMLQEGSLGRARGKALAIGEPEQGRALVAGHIVQRAPHVVDAGRSGRDEEHPKVGPAELVDVTALLPSGLIG